MAGTVGSHGVAAFTNPSNGDALDATVVKGNDNTLRSAYVDHDSDGGIHLQSSSLASRPSAGTLDRKWLTTDTGSIRLWYDNGTSWEEVNYVQNTGSVSLQNVSITGTLTVDTNVLVVDITNNRVGINTATPLAPLDVVGNAAFSANVTVGGGVTVTGAVIADTVTATTFTGSGSGLTSIPAAQLTGTLPAISGVNLTNLNASNLASGTVDTARLPTSYTSLTLGNIGIGVAGANVIQATSGSIVEVRECRLLGTTSTTTGSYIDLRTSASYFLNDPSGSSSPTWWIGNNASSTNSTPQGGPNGYTTYTANGARFLKVDFEGTEYFIRMERWTA